MKRRVFLFIALLGFWGLPLQAVAEDAPVGGPLLGALLNPDEAFIYDDHGNRNPFSPLVTANGSIVTLEKDLLITDMILEGIMTEGGGNNIAIINGRILGENDLIGAFEITDISKNTVILQKGQKIYTLKLKKEE